MYNIMVSGILNILNVILNILIILFAAITAMYAVGTILIVAVVSAPAGIAIIAIASGLMLGIFIPVLVMYILLAMFMVDTFGAKAQPNPFR
jgi:hypothetical protein